MKFVFQRLIFGILMCQTIVASAQNSSNFTLKDLIKNATTNAEMA
jgi:hypothetical protein